MKLRIRGNSIRIRLLQGEVKALETVGFVTERVSFPEGKALHYKLQLASDFDAQFSGDTITLSIPKEFSLEWLKSEELSLRNQLSISANETLSLLVEKDLACLTKRDGDEDKDTFPNPAKTC